MSGGTCGKCGAPWFYDVPGGAWFGIMPPPIRPTCMCWNLPTTVTTSTVHVCCTCCSVCHHCGGRKVYP